MRVGAPTLYSTGAPLATREVVLYCTERWRCGEETARRRITRLCADARAVDVEVSPERWRRRGAGAEGLDVSIQIVRDDVLAIITSVNIRRDSSKKNPL